MVNVAVIGCGYVGLLTGTVLASKNIDSTFTLLDIDVSKIDSLKRKQYYLNEQGFAEIFDGLHNINLTVNYEDLRDCSIIFIAVNTPDDHGKCNMSYLYSTIDYINKYCKNGAIIIVKSTVEVGTTQDLYRNKLRSDFYVFNIPEFLAEGEAINNLLNPIRILIGYTDVTKENYQSKLAELLNLYHYVAQDKIVVTDCNTSELIKLSSNFMLAQRIASINAIEHLAKEKHANIVDISRILRMDERIGRKFLSPSAGFGGSCFRKDINNISNICNDKFYKDYFHNVNIVNDYHMIEIASEIANNSTVLFLGYGFKETTEDTRESPTQFIIDYLHKSIKYHVYDANIAKFKDENLLTTENHYDYIIIMNNEEKYVSFVNSYISSANSSHNSAKNTVIINPRYIQLKQ